MLSVEPENDSGADTVVACATPLLLVERMVAGRSETVRLEVEAVVEYRVAAVIAVEEAYAICEVDDACRPFWNQTIDEVAAATEA